MRKRQGQASQRRRQHRTDQRQGNDQQGYDRNRECIGQRADERILREQQHGQRQQADADSPLRARARDRAGKKRR